MSYSAIIQKDSPAIIYSLDDSSVSNNADIAPDRFLYSNPNGSGFYNGNIMRYLRFLFLLYLVESNPLESILADL
jgi:hypothetical protein